jgi:hypothetical protein
VSTRSSRRGGTPYPGVWTLPKACICGGLVSANLMRGPSMGDGFVPGRCDRSHSTRNRLLMAGLARNAWESATQKLLGCLGSYARSYRTLRTVLSVEVFPGTSCQARHEQAIARRMATVRLSLWDEIHSLHGQRRLYPSRSLECPNSKLRREEYGIPALLLPIARIPLLPFLVRG